MDRFKLGAAVVLIIALLGFLAFVVTAKNMDTTLQASLVALATTSIAGLVHLIRTPSGDSDSKGPPSNLPALIMSVGTIVASSAMLGCTSHEAKRAEAAGAYANDVARCDDAAPKLGPDAGAEQRRAAWNDYDACMSKVHAKWGITVTSTKDGGQ